MPNPDQAHDMQNMELMYLHQLLAQRTTFYPTLLLQECWDYQEELAQDLALLEVGY
jgi:hypothetical protein